MDEALKIKLEASAFRALQKHLMAERTDVQNIDLMNLSGFCRNCLSNWYKEEAEELGINIDKRFTIMFGVAAAVAGLAGVMYTPINPPNYHMGMDFLVISFVVVVVGGMGSLPGAVAAGLLLGILESFASMRQVIEALPGINQVVIYLAAIVILLTRPRGLMGRKGVMED